MKRIVIIDGNSLINRAYYAMQRPMITKDGIFTQGIYGFINMLSKILEDYSPEYITVTFDLKAPTFRHKAYKDYKAGRQKMPPELAMQMPLLKDVLHAMNIKTVELEGYEADDLIGTISREFEELGIEPLVITGDKDALQLCSDVTKVIITKKGISEFDLYDRNKMIEVYSLTPNQFIDLKGLMGDKSDNIPGIPGVGEKTGIKLLKQFETVENLINNYNEIENANLRQKVEDNIDLILLSKKLATINRNVPLEIDPQSFIFAEPNLEELREIYSKLEFNKFLKKLSSKDISESFEKKEFDIIKVNDLSQLDALNNEECFIKVFSDDNHREAPNARCLGLAVSDKIYFVDIKSKDFQKDLIDKLGELNLKLKGHGIKKDLYYLMQSGLSSFQVVFDTEIAAYVLNPGRSSYDFKGILMENLFLEIDEEKDAIGTSSQTSFFEEDLTPYITYLETYFGFLEQLTSYLSNNIIKEDLNYVFEKIELPLIRVLASMEIAGIHVDKEVLNSIGEGLIDEADKLQKQIFEIAGEEFNINSPKQLGVILFEKLKLPAGKKNKNGYSTSADVLDKLRDKTPIIDLILRYRTVTKLNSTYVEGLVPLISSDKRVHAHFQQTVTATGRISCTEPNLQNIPVRDPSGRELRKAYVSPDGYVLVGADYSQIELRVLAHLSKDENLVEAFNNGEDIHKLTASKVLGIPVEKITDEDRRKAKAVNFGVIYGMSSFGLSEEVKISRKEAEKYINDYFDRYTGVKAFLDEQIQHAKENGYTLTAMGRKRYVNELKSSNFMVRQFGERLAMNTPIQGTAADIIKLAMISVYNLLNSENIESSMILQVHDELILRVKQEYADKAANLLKEAMESAYEMIVPLKSEPAVGKSWFELK